MTRYYFMFLGGVTVVVWAAVLLPKLAAEHVRVGRLAQAITLVVVGVVGASLVVLGPHVGPFAPVKADLGPSAWVQRLAVAALLSVAAMAVATRTGRSHAGGGLLAAAVGFAMASALTFAGRPADAVLPFVSVLPAVVFYLSAADWPTTLRLLRWVLRGIVWPSIALGLAGPGWAVLEDDGRSLLGISRLSGLAGHPNALGAAAAALLLLELAEPRPRRWVWCAAVAAVTLAFTESRTAVLGCALGLLWMLASRRGAPRWAAVVGSLTVIVGLLRAPLDIGGLTGRTDLWRYAWAEFRAHPFTGYGAGFLDADYRASHLPDRLAWAGQAHDQLLHTLAASGLVGGAAVVTYLFVLGVAALQAVRFTGGAAAGLLGLLAAECVTETPLLPVFGTLLVLHLALLATTFAGLRARRSESVPARTSVVPATRTESLAPASTASALQRRRP